MRSVSKFVFLCVVPLFGIGTQFLSLPTTAHQLAMGLHPTVKSYSSSNPALYTAPAHHPDFSIHRGEWFGDVSLTQLSLNQTRQSGIWHMGLRYASLTGLEYRDHIPQDNATATFSTYGISTDIGLALQRETKTFGFKVQGIHMGLYSETSTGISVDFGFVQSFKKGISVGATLSNIGWMSPLDTGAPKLPFQISGGLSKSFHFNNYKNQIHCSATFNQSSGNISYQLGNQFQFERLQLLGGFSSSKNVVEASTGFGLQLYGLNVAYGIRFGSQQLGTPQVITIQMNLP